MENSTLKNAITLLMSKCPIYAYKQTKLPFFLNPDPAHKFCDADGQTKQKYCVSLKLY